MRTQDEIVEKLLAINKEKHLFDFRRDMLVVFLDREHAELVKGISLKEDADLSDWKEDDLSDEVILEKMKDYMDFAWDKAQNHRGLSANRSIQRLEAWCWLLGEDELVEALENGPYAVYGAPGLAKVSEKFGWPIPPGEDIERMIRGLPCVPNCEKGCLL